MTTSYALLFHHHNFWWLNFASVICDYFCAHRRCCFSAIQIFPQSLISKLQKDSPKDKARPKCGPSSGTLGPIHMIFTGVHLLYCAGLCSNLSFSTPKPYEWYCVIKDFFGIYFMKVYIELRKIIQTQFQPNSLKSCSPALGGKKGKGGKNVLR